MYQVPGGWEGRVVATRLSTPLLAARPEPHGLPKTVGHLVYTFYHRFIFESEIIALFFKTRRKGNYRDLLKINNNNKRKLSYAFEFQNVWCTYIPRSLTTHVAFKTHYGAISS